MRLIKDKQRFELELEDGDGGFVLRAKGLVLDIWPMSQDGRTYFAVRQANFYGSGHGLKLLDSGQFQAWITSEGES